MNILAGILFIVAALSFLVCLADIGNGGIIVLHIIKAIIGLAALVIAYLISAQQWICIVGTISVAIEIINTILSLFSLDEVDWSFLRILTIIAGVLAMFANVTIGIAMFF